MTVIDPYYDNKIGDLRNLLGARSSQELKEREAQIVFANELDITPQSISRTNNLNELLAIHKSLFGDIYDWAGEIRTVDIRKPDEDASFFLPVSKIRDACAYVFSELQSEHCLQGLDRSIFVQRIAYYYDQLNYVHPFREGNGRTQRTLWGRVAYDTGYEIDWSAATSDENDQASKLAAESMELSGLVAMFEKITSPL